MVDPSAAVTVTTKVFSPSTRFSPPTISNVAAGSSVSTSTNTEVSPVSTSNTSPSTTSTPLIVNFDSSVFVFSGTTMITV